MKALSAFGAPEHELLESMLFPWLFRRDRLDGSVWSRLVYSFALALERTADKLRQALDAGPLAPPVVSSSRIEGFGRHRRHTLTTAKIPLRDVGMHGTEHGRSAACQRGHIVDRDAMCDVTASV